MFRRINELLIELDNRSSLVKNKKDDPDISFIEKPLGTALLIADEIIKIISPHAVLNDNLRDIMRNIVRFQNNKYEKWFTDNPVTKGNKAAVIHYADNNSLFETKFYWLSASSTKARVSGGVQLTPNWEDNDLTRTPALKVGIDFFLAADQSSLLVVLSNRGKLRILTLEGRLSNTQVDVLNNISGAGELSNQEIIHTALWDAFAVQPINKKFYEGIADHFTQLVDFLTSKNGGKRTQDEAKQFTNRLLGRLLFVWFLRKKKFIAEEEFGYFKDFSDATNYYETKLKPLFFKTLNTQIDYRKTKDKITPFLNGGLFDAFANDFTSEKVQFPAIYFTSLYNHFDSFNFTTDESSPEYEQIAIDPEMLGRIFENLLASIDDATAKNARKAKGAFYTPREIVSYMCKESLRQYLYTNLIEEQERKGIDKLLDTTDADVEKQDTNFKRDLLPNNKGDNLAKEIIKTLDKIKVVDPACGSGAFPMGMVQLLLRTYSRLGIQDINTTDKKLQIIQNNIYGVDIEPMAIEIARLRAWLSIIVDEDDIKKVKPLPNLDFKIVQGDSLMSIDKQDLFHAVTLGQLEKLKDLFFATSIAEEKKGLVKQISNILKSFSKDGIFDFNIWFSEVFRREKKGFDIVVGNPPYISTKGTTKELKKKLESEYGFADDTYSHFFFKSFKLLSEGGIVTYISPKTFWTTQTKKNLRELLLSKNVNIIFDTANPFSEAMVDTCITSVSNKKGLNNQIHFLDGSVNLANPVEYSIAQGVYVATQNSVIFKPTSENLRIYDLYGKKVKELYNTWWDKISTSKNIEKNKNELEKYRKSLKPGDVALLGCLTEGGQGLATANNGKYIAVRKSTKWAKNIIESRPKKLEDVIKTYKVKIPELAQYNDTANYLASLNEKEIAILFDQLKEKYGRDIFGQGYLYRLIDDIEIADVDTLTTSEKENGIDISKKYYVPYDKGDKDGNRWYLETPFAIAWSKENVHYLKTNSGKKGEGMPVVRNLQYNFREGFCWTDINSTYLKARLKKQGAFDVVSMSLFTQVEIPDWYFVCLINSEMMSFYVDNFVNNTSHFQINDARQIPIIIPSKEVIVDFDIIFKTAYNIKREMFAGKMSVSESEKQLLEIQKKLDKMVNKLYHII